MPRTEQYKKREREIYQIRKKKLEASKIMHELQKKYGDTYCLCCITNLPPSNFLYNKPKIKSFTKKAQR